MKAVIFTGLVLLAQASFARCFDLIKTQSQRPLVSIGNIQLAAPAERICIQESNSDFHGATTEVVLSDSIGDLAQFSATKTSQARCGEDCGVTYQLHEGNSNGENVNADYVSITIATQHKANLGTYQNGTLTLKTSRSLPQVYLISTK